jgi:N-acetylglutamate synthase-like GNAT family acetyltransferase
MYIRSACAEDQQRIKTIVRRAHINPFGLDWRRFVVVEDQGVVVGVGQVKTHWDGTRELASLAMMPERQGHGVGRVLVQALLANEPGTVYLMCGQKMHVYYVFFGFRRVPYDAIPPHLRMVSTLFNTVMIALGKRQRVIVMRRAGQ